MEEKNQEDIFLDEISCEQVQGFVDDILGKDTFSFQEYVRQIMTGQSPVSAEGVVRMLLDGVGVSMAQAKKTYLMLFLLAVIGAVIHNFSKLLQGKQVAQTAFFAVYLLLFSVLCTSFVNISQMAEEKMQQLLEFMKVLSPAYFTSLALSQGGITSGAYYEFVLVMITIADYILVQFVLPALHVYFMLRLANEFSEQELFSKMADLIRDVVKFVMKTMFGIVMGLNVIQGLILPVSSKIETSAAVKVAGAIPGVGNTISTIANTVLCAGGLVKNSIGVAGVLFIALFCGVPLLYLVISKWIYQLMGAVLQPILDKRVLSCFGAMEESIGLLLYCLFVGTMLFIVTISMISVMT